MGSRANLVVRDRSGWTLHYNHWAAQRIDHVLLWGPSHVEQFIRAQVSVDWWLDETWAEGGVLLDLVNRRLLWFGGEETCDPVRWTVQHRLLRAAWPEWDVEWCFSEMADIADALGVSRSEVTSDRDEEVRFSAAPLRSISGEAASPHRARWWKRGRGVVPAGPAATLVTVVREGQVVGAFDCMPYASLVASRGPDLIPHDLAEPRSARLTQFPRSGLHIDLDERTLRWWQVAGRQDLEQAGITSVWTGWTILPLHADWDKHRRLVNDQVSWPEMDLRAGAQHALDYFRSSPGPPDLAASIGALEHAGLSGVVSPLISADIGVNPSTRLKVNTIEAAYAECGWSDLL